MTSKDKVKESLLNDKKLLIHILEELGCHRINPNFSENEIRCALPDGETGTSVSIKLETYIPCQVFSRGAFEDYEIKDIISLVQFIKGINFSESVKWLCELIDIEYESGYLNNSQTLDIVSELRYLKRKSNHKEEVFAHKKLDLSVLRKYKTFVVQEWVKEGISANTQKKYGIRNDEVGKRWIIPIYDENNNLISLKARTYAPNWKEMGITKYIYYFKLNGNDILFGLNFNKQSIKEHDEIILFEAEKSVMVSDSYGYDWTSSLGTNSINKYLKKKILSLKCSNCVLAFDKDVNYNDAVKEAKKLNKYMNVYIIHDKEGLLSDKDSPIDRGYETWKRLYDARIRVR